MLTKLAQGTLTGCTLTGNVARFNGGGILLEAGFLNVTDSEFRNNAAQLLGGAILAEGGISSKVQVSSSLFSRNEAQHGAALSVDCWLSLLNSTAQYNSAVGYGGAVYVTSMAFLVAAQNTVQHNTAAISGGGVYSLGYNEWRDSIIQNNTAAYSGAGVAIYGGAGTMSNIHLLDNHALEGAGLTVSGGARLQCTRCVVSRNSAAANTGPDLAGLSFASVSQMAVGGGVAVQQRSHLRCMACSVENNTASVGGGLWVFQAKVQLNDTRVVANTAQHGGGLSVNSSRIVMWGCNVSNNVADYGGGLGWACSKFGGCEGSLISNSELSGNSAVGGGLFWDQLGDSFVSNLHSLFPPLYEAMNGNPEILGAIPNTADFGPIAASEATSLHATSSGYIWSMRSIREAGMLQVSLKDVYNQTLIDRTRRTSGTKDSPVRDFVLNAWGISGETLVNAYGQYDVVTGIATFETMIISATVGTKARLVFSIFDQAEEDTDKRYRLPTYFNLSLAACPSGSIPSVDKQSCTLCTAGKYAVKLGDTECRECPTGAVCYGGSNIVAKKDYWNDRASTVFDWCPFSLACLGGELNNNTIDVNAHYVSEMMREGTHVRGAQCAQGYTGRVCAICADGYLLSAAGCDYCGGDGQSPGIRASAYGIVLLAFVGSAVLILVSWLARKLYYVFKETHDQQIRELAEDVFALFDVDKSGRLSRHEFIDAMTDITDDLRASQQAALRTSQQASEVTERHFVQVLPSLSVTSANPNFICLIFSHYIFVYVPSINSLAFVFQYPPRLTLLFDGPDPLIHT